MRAGQVRAGQVTAGRVFGGALVLVLLTAGPAVAENPVLDPEDDAELVDALAEATAVHDVCYGYVLQVNDNDTGIYEGTYVVTNAGVGVEPTTATCSRGTVLLNASLTYASELSESEDSAGWRVGSSLGGPTTSDLEAQGLSAGDLTDDGKAPTTLRNAVLALPSLTASQHSLPPLVLTPNTEPLPADASATGSPGSDWVRQSTGLIVLCVLVLLAGLAVLASSFSSVRRAASAAGATMKESAQ